jgi:nucleoside-diphosphate-sugar epimerase
MKKILITGAFGLVGSDLVDALVKKHKADKIIALSHNTKSNIYAHIEVGDVQDKTRLKEIVVKNDIGTIYHLAGLLSVRSEKDPDLAWSVNLGGLKNILDIAKEFGCKVFWPSSIAAFGPTTPKTNTPQNTILEPTTMYGVNKVAGELLCQYYFLRYGVDVRSLRYPGLIGYKAPPGDGTTEYSVHIFYGAIQKNSYDIFLNKDSALPMMYIDDAIDGTIALMDVPSEKISIRTSYNFSAISFTPEDLVNEIKLLNSNFVHGYAVDPIKQRIADSWPKSIDDSKARTDWGWSHKYDLKTMTKTMYDNLKIKLDSKDV